MRKKRRSRSEWRAIVAEWRRSGLPAGEFASARGDAFTAANLRAWSSKLGVKRRESGVDFVEVAAVPLVDRAPKAVLRLPSGLSIRLLGPIAPDEVAALVRALGG